MRDGAKHAMVDLEAGRVDYCQVRLSRSLLGFVAVLAVLGASGLGCEVVAGVDKSLVPIAGASSSSSVSEGAGGAGGATSSGVGTGGTSSSSSGIGGASSSSSGMEIGRAHV